MESQDEMLPSTSQQIDHNGESMKAFMEAYVNERCAPELLHYQHQLVQQVRDQVEERENLVARMEKHRPGQRSGNQQQKQIETDLLSIIYTQEVDRIKHLLRAYHRCRLQKIQDFCLHILDVAEEFDKLSPQEGKFLEEYFGIFLNHMKQNVLKHLPEGFQSMIRQHDATSKGCDTKTEFDLDATVFCRVLRHCDNVELDDEGQTTVDFKPGDSYAVSYRRIRKLLQDGMVKLI